LETGPVLDAGRPDERSFWVREDRETMTKFNPGQYIREIRREVSKVTWPSRKETTVSTGMVFVMVFVAALFFFLIDQVLSTLVKMILSI
jgi:preprotein translocase subunit SecE